MSGYKIGILYGADLTTITAKTAKNSKYSVMCIMSGMGRGTPRVRYTLLKLHSKISPSSVSFLSPTSILKEEKKKAIPLQTETRLMLDIVLKELRGGMYLKISERKQVVFNTQKHFPISE